MDLTVVKTLFMKGDIPTAIEYLRRFPEGAELAEALRAVFEREQYVSYDIPEELNGILLEYQRYYRDVFYLLLPDGEAAAALAERLRARMGIASAEPGVLEQALKTCFEAGGLHILTGRTNGHYGPYVWRETVPTDYDVELPGGTRQYRVNILRGFVMRSWMDYLTFGEFGTGGWTDENGTINCVEKAYDFESSRFRISLLKHEAQHAEDLSRWPEMPSRELEYRAKLVELIYSGDPELLRKFLLEADSSQTDNGHAMASARIAEEMGDRTACTPEEITRRARALFAASTAQWEQQSPGQPAAEA